MLGFPARVPFSPCSERKGDQPTPLLDSTGRNNGEAHCDNRAAALEVGPHVQRPAEEHLPTRASHRAPRPLQDGFPAAVHYAQVVRGGVPVRGQLRKDRFELMAEEVVRPRDRKHQRRCKGRRRVDPRAHSLDSRHASQPLNRSRSPCRGGCERRRRRDGEIQSLQPSALYC